MLPVIYARFERTLDEMLLREARVKLDINLDFQKYQDVVLYHDKECTQFARREPWHRETKPTHRNRYQTINCARYKLVWVN